MTKLCSLKYFGWSSCVAGLFCLAQPAFSQDQSEDDARVEEEIVVKGSYQRSLENALNEKRLADTVLDVVAAEDLGKLPDISIAEALSRLPGVITNRDRGNATEVSVRGLGPNLSGTLLNGREVASGENSRNVRYENYPSELLGGAYVYKSIRADRPAGGVAGVVDLRTVRPLDFAESRVVLNIRGSYFEFGQDIADSEPLGYTGSISYLDQWLDGTLGVAFGYARREQSIATQRSNIFPISMITDTAQAGRVGLGSVGFIPFGFEALIRGGNDDRNSLVSVVQWSPSENFEIKADFFFSRVDFVEEQRGFRTSGSDNIYGNTYSDLVLADRYLTGATIDQTAGWGLDLRTVNEEYVLKDDLYAGGVESIWRLGQFVVTGNFGYSEVTRQARFLSVETQVHDVSGSAPVRRTTGLQARFETPGSGASRFSFNVDLSDPTISLLSRLRVPSSDTVTDQIFTYALDGSLDINNFPLLRGVSFGVRFSDRKKQRQGRSFSNTISEGDRRPVPAGLLTDPLRGFGSFSDLPPLLTFNRSSVVNDVFGGYDPQESQSDQIRGFIVEEDILSGYFQADFSGDMSSVEFSGNAGVRFARTETRSSSMRLLDENGSVSVVPISIPNTLDEILPSLNLSFSYSDYIVRFAASRSISRAPLDDLSAGVSEFDYGTPQGFGGNPLLEPFRTWNFDLTGEWYFSQDGALTLSGFYKNIESYIVRETQTDVELPSGAIGRFTRPVNGDGGYLYGLEGSFNQKLTFLPGFLNGLGVYANYTLIRSNINVSPAFVAGSYPLPGLVENSYNLVFWYFRSGFEGRVSYKYKDSYPVELGDVPDQIQFNGSEGVIDLQLSYELPKDSAYGGWQILFQVNNLTNEPFYTYFASNPSVRGRYEEFGRRYWLGVSYGYDF